MAEFGRRSWLLAARATTALGLTMAVSACGFRPLYAHAPDGEGPAEIGLAEINVPVMPERTGQIFRQALQARFERGGSGLGRRYDLTATFAVASAVQGIQQDSSITRIRYIGTSNWSLIAQDTRRTTLKSGTARAVDGLNIFVNQYFATDMESQAVEQRIAEALADQVALQLGAYFTEVAAK